MDTNSLLSNHLLEVENLSISFPGSGAVISNLSFSVAQKKVLGVVGASGSGKSLTAYSIMRLLPNNATINGLIKFQPNEKENYPNLLTLSEKKMQGLRGKSIAMIFQEPLTALNPSFRCGTLVVEAIRNHSHVSKAVGKELCLELFEEVQLPRPSTLFDAYPHQLSGGQRQRVLIAMALAHKPRLLIADEPTTALDATVQLSILDLLQQLKKRYAMSILFITHDLGVLSRIAEDVLVMQAGRVVEQGSIDSILYNAKHSYTRGLIACKPPLLFRVKRLPTLMDYDNLQPGENIFDAVRQTQEEYIARQEQIKNSPHLLKADNLKLYHITKKNFWGKPKETVKAVDHISFEIRKGETLGLVGESGSGKTTLGKVLLRLIEPQSGTIIFEQLDWLKISNENLRKSRCNFQIIFQDPYSALNPRQKIGQTILEPMQIHKLFGNTKQQKERVIYLLETVGLKPEHYERFPDEFSGGQRQRICIARALALQPKLVVCDEPVSALDVSAQAQVLNLLIDLREKFELSYLFITHDLSIVKLIADRVMVMQNGQIVEIQETETLFSSPQQNYTQKLLNSILSF